MRSGATYAAARARSRARRCTAPQGVAGVGGDGMRNALSGATIRRATSRPESTMQHAVEAAYAPPTTAPAPRPIRALPIQEEEVADPREAVIRRLAADRLRDLRDDGLTLAYAARMYGIDAGEMAALEAELLPWKQR